MIVSKSIYKAEGRNMRCISSDFSLSMYDPISYPTARIRGDNNISIDVFTAIRYTHTKEETNPEFPLGCLLGYRGIGDRLRDNIGEGDGNILEALIRIIRADEAQARIQTSNIGGIR